MYQAYGTGRDSACALLIEADEAYRAVIAACILHAGCQTESVTDMDAALTMLADHDFDLLVWGVSAGEAFGRLEVLRELQVRSSARLILLGHSSDSAPLDLEAGASLWLQKPFVPGALVGAVRSTLRKAAHLSSRFAQ